LVAEKLYGVTLTTKVAGLKPLKVSKARASKILSKIKTGFELRPAVIVKNKIKKKKVKRKMKRRKK